MRGIVQSGIKLSLSEKASRLYTRLKDPQWRRFGGTLVAGKMLGLAMTLFLMLALPTLIAAAPKFFESKTAHAQTSMPATMAMPSTMAASAPATTAAAAAAPADPTTTQPAMVSDLKDATKNPSLNPLNTTWTLVAAFLVFGMQAGFTMLEAGFCRSRETVNVLVECAFDTCLCGLLFYAWGYAFMFGQGNGLIGWHDPTDTAATGIHTWFFLQNGAATALYATTGVPVLAHWVFQFAFADCASTICSGTMIGRTGFWGDIIYSVFVSGFIYPIIGHWAWGPDGMLYTMGGQNPAFLADGTTHEAFTTLFSGVGLYFHDFAGSTVVHSIGGWIALAGGIVLGPRIGRKFKRDGGTPMLPHDLTVAVVGGFILWFGWYGFNPGSTLSAMDFIGIGRIAANTTLAASTGGLAAIFFIYFRTGKWDAGAITNGFLAGLVAITCPCYWVSPTGACWLGAIAGIIVILGVDLLEYLRIDDPIGAWPVHGLCGVWGTLSLGLFGSGEYNIGGSGGPAAPAIFNAAATPGVGSDPTLFYTGLFYGNHDWHALAAQAIGSFTICAATFIIAFTIFKVLDLCGILRISKEGEIEGMDIHEHGISAYPEYVISALAAPAGMPADTVNFSTKPSRIAETVK
jgi:Amt family ammonium transporter